MHIYLPPERGKKDVTSLKQAIAIGLSKARQAGVKLPPRKARKAKDSRKNSKSRAKAA